MIVNLIPIHYNYIYINPNKIQLKLHNQLIKTNILNIYPILEKFNGGFIMKCTDQNNQMDIHTDDLTPTDHQTLSIICTICEEE